MIEQQQELRCHNFDTIKLFYGDKDLFTTVIDSLETRLTIQCGGLQWAYVLTNQTMMPRSISLDVSDLIMFHRWAKWADDQGSMHKPMNERQHQAKHWRFNFCFKDVLGYYFDIFYYVNHLEFG